VLLCKCSRGRVNCRSNAHLLQEAAEEMMRSERLVRLSPSMMARETQRIHPVAPLRKSPTGPGAQPRARASGPSAA
jgi:hypothetical protein